MDRILGGILAGIPGQPRISGIPARSIGVRWHAATHCVVGIQQHHRGMDAEAGLADLGMGVSAVRVYLALLRSGPCAASVAARQARIRRPTVYGALGELAERGLVVKTMRGSRALYAAETPRRLLEWPRRQEAAVRALLPELLALAGSAPARPRIAIYEGVAGIIQVNEDLLTVKSGEYRYIGSTQEMFDVLGEAYLKDYVRRRVALGIRSWAIRVRGREVGQPWMGDGERWLRKVRYLHQNVAGDLVSIYLYDQKVAVVSGMSEGFAMIIDSGELSTMLGMLWKVVWAVAEPP
jgi:hypothetical protein